ncbi:hypothetical protein ASG11_05165 [Sphingomonas sp. Leaf357]|nr:hypothetical protein ASG11_05165 [Sphingomonas sp. Leaf357]
MELLARRSPSATVCPSEVARALANTSGAGQTLEDWRSAMPMVHAAVDRLLSEGSIQLSWQGRRMQARAGPYRIGRRQDGAD